MATIQDLLMVNLDKVPSAPLKEAITNFLKDYKKESDKTTFEQEHRENISKLMSMVQRYAPDAVGNPATPKTEKKPSGKKEKSDASSGNRKRKESDGQKGLMKVLFVVIGNFRGVLEELKASDLEEADYVVVLELTEQLEKALESGNEEAIRKAVESARAKFVAWEKQMKERPDEKDRETGKRAKEAFNELLEELELETLEADAVENQTVLLTHDLVGKVINELVDVESDLELHSEEATMMASGRYDLEKALKQTSHAAFKKEVQEAVEKLSYFAGELTDPDAGKEAFESINKLRNALGKPLLDEKGEEKKETEKQRSQRVLEELEELEPELERCRAVVREANRQKREAKGTKPKPKPTRYTQLKKHMLAIIDLVPPQLKDDPVVQENVRRLSQNFVAGFVEICQMNKVKAKPVSDAIDEKLEEPEDKESNKTNKK